MPDRKQEFTSMIAPVVVAAAGGAAYLGRCGQASNNKNTNGPCLSCIDRYFGQEGNRVR